MINGILLKELLIKKAHIGTRTWNKDTAQFLLGFRESPGIPKFSIFNLEKTLIGISEVLSFLNSLAIQHFSSTNISSFETHPLHIYKKNEGQETYKSSESYFKRKKNVSQALKKKELKPQDLNPSSNFSRPLSILILATNTSQEGSFQLNIFKIFSKFQLTRSYYSFSLMDTRWVGGTLTNWKQIAQSISLYSNFKKKYSAFLFKQNIRLPLHQRNEKRYKFLESMATELPDLIIVTNPEENSLALKEAKLAKIPVIGFINSNLKPDILNLIDYVIPGNNKSPEFISFCLHLFFVVLKKIEK
jgi:ribosomal protein S2